MRYFMLGPGSRDGHGAAFMPGIPVSPKASSNRAVRITGQPGTAPIDVHKPKAIPPTAMVRTNQGSYLSPDIIFPAIYIAHADNMHAPVSLFRDNQMPVPAVDMYNFPRNSSYGAPFAGRVPSPAMRRRRMGTRLAMRWPAAPQVWQ